MNFDECQRRADAEAILRRRRGAWRPTPAIAAWLGLLIFSIVGAVIYPQTGSDSQPSQTVAPIASPPLVPPAPSSVGPLSPERERTLKPKDSFRECDKCPDIIVVPAGNFVMGSPDNEKGRDLDEGPQHEVAIPKPFAVARFDVTFDEGDAC